MNWDIPGSLVVKSLPSNARGTGTIPSQGTKIPHTTEQLSPHTTTREVSALQRRPSAAEIKNQNKTQGSS